MGTTATGKASTGTTTTRKDPPSREEEEGEGQALPRTGVLRFRVGRIDIHRHKPHVDDLRDHCSGDQPLHPVSVHRHSPAGCLLYLRPRHRGTAQGAQGLPRLRLPRSGGHPHRHPLRLLSLRRPEGGVRAAGRGGAVAHRHMEMKNRPGMPPGRDFPYWESMILMRW